MNLGDTISVDMTVGTLSVMIGGLYVGHTGISMEAIPSSMFIEVAETLTNYLPLKDILVEDWIKNFLIIAPRELFSEDELEAYRNNEIFIERKLGNATLIATGKLP